MEMNLYPRLGKPFYNNYVEWGRNIYKPKESPTREIEKVNLEDRFLWGGLKNLISGVGTVVHHNPWHKILDDEKFPVQVLRKISWSHSLKFGKDIQRAFPKDSTPFIIHAAEGVDEMARQEIGELDRMGLLQSNTVLVHGVAIGNAELQLIKARGASLIWCPTTNLFMLGRTAAIDKIKIVSSVALGTDSTLTGSPTLLDELKIAFETGLATQEEIFSMVTNVAASIHQMESPEISTGSKANFFLLPKRVANYLNNIFECSFSDIALVVKLGKPVLGDEVFALPELKHEFFVNGVKKRSTLNVRELKKRIDKEVPLEFLEQNPLWVMVN
jgi:hypothetical protein